MFINLYNQTVRIFLADVTPDMADVREELHAILHRAGMQIVDSGDVKQDELKDVMQQTDCSVHILGSDDIFAQNGDTSAGRQYHAAKELCAGKYKMFVWNPQGKANRSQYINAIRREYEEEYETEYEEAYSDEEIEESANKEAAAEETEPVEDGEA